MSDTCNELYLVWSNEHRGWWKQSHGYTSGLNKAGRFSRETAMKICRNAVLDAAHQGTIAELPVRLADVIFFIGTENVPRVIMMDDLRD